MFKHWTWWRRKHALICIFCCLSANMFLTMCLSDFYQLEILLSFTLTLYAENQSTHTHTLLIHTKTCTRQKRKSINFTHCTEIVTAGMGMDDMILLMCLYHSPHWVQILIWWTMKIGALNTIRCSIKTSKISSFCPFLQWIPNIFHDEIWWSMVSLL